jgi:hypothetical protein
MRLRSSRRRTSSPCSAAHIDTLSSFAEATLGELRKVLPRQQQPAPCTAVLTPARTDTLEGKTLILPNCDDITSIPYLKCPRCRTLSPPRFAPPFNEVTDVYDTLEQGAAGERQEFLDGRRGRGGRRS